MILEGQRSDVRHDAGFVEVQVRPDLGEARLMRIMLYHTL